MEPTAYCQEILQVLRSPERARVLRERFAGCDRIQLTILVASLARPAQTHQQFEAQLEASADQATRSGHGRLAVAVAALIEDWRRQAHEQTAGADSLSARKA
jgi:hypothetical protein